jgi:hypothetical protein
MTYTSLAQSFLFITSLLRCRPLAPDATETSYHTRASSKGPALLFAGLGLVVGCLLCLILDLGAREGVVLPRWTCWCLRSRGRETSTSWTISARIRHQWGRLHLRERRAIFCILLEQPLFIASYAPMHMALNSGFRLWPPSRAIL